MSTEHPESLKVTSAEEIRKIAAEKKKGTLLKLPSGFVVKVSEPDMTEMIREGYLPSELVEVAINSANGSNKQDPKNIPLFFDFMKVMIVHSVLEPKIIDGVVCKENEILYSDLSDSDKLFIFNWWRAEGKSLETFREKEQVNNEKLGPDMQKVSGNKAK